MGFNQQSVNGNGGVAWAKQVGDSMDPGAIESQIQGYQNAVTSLSQVQTTLQNVKNNLAASWTGAAAEQAQQSFQGSIDHTQLVQDTITQTVVPALQSAKSAQQTYMASVAKVPNEQTVPSNSFVDDVGSFFGVESPAQKAEAHNTTVRTQAADALNTLSDSYESSASKLALAGGGEQGTFTQTNTSAFNLGTVPSSSGDGAATSYGEGISSGTYASRSEYTASPSGSVTPAPDPKTTLSGTGDTGGGGTITEPPPSQVGTTQSPNPSPFDPYPIWGSTGPVESDPGYGGGSGLITDEPGGGPGDGVGSGGLGDGDYDGGSGKLGGNGGVFDETGMGDGELTGGTGTGLRNGMSNTDGTGLGGDGDTVGGSGGMAEGEGGESVMGGGGMGRGMGGGLGSGDEELASSKYSRGRYIGVTEEDDNPSLSPVRSAFEDATDADGNKVDMMGSGRSGASGDDEEDERGKRPSYLKEDEFWKNAQRIVPPVIQ
jgi:hypothetical protein